MLETIKPSGVSQLERIQPRVAPPPSKPPSSTVRARATTTGEEATARGRRRETQREKRSTSPPAPPALLAGRALGGEGDAESPRLRGLAQHNADGEGGRERERKRGGILAYTDTEPGEVWRRALHEHDDANRSCGGRFFTDGVAQRRPVLLLRRRCPEPEQEPARQDGRQLRRRGLRSALFLSGCQAAWPSHQLRCRQADGRVRPQPREQQLRVPQSLHPHPLRLHR